MGHQLYTEGNRLKLTAWFLTPNTLGSILADGTALTVVDATGFATSDPIFVEGAGAAGGDLITSVASVAGNVITLAAPALTTIDLGIVGKRVVPTSITFKVKQPPRAGGSTETFLAPHAQITNPLTGQYVLAYSPASHGTYRWRAEGTGTALGTEEDSFVVERSEIV